MEETKKLDEASKSEELAERVELTDEELDQASGGHYFCQVSDTKRDGIGYGRSVTL